MRFRGLIWALVGSVAFPVGCGDAGDRSQPNTPRVPGGPEVGLSDDGKFEADGGESFGVDASGETIRNLGPLDKGDIVDSTPREAGGTSTVYYRVSVDRGEFIEVSQKNADRTPADIDLVDGRGRVVAETRQATDYRFEISAGRYLYYYSPTTQPLLLRVRSSVEKPLPDLVVRLRVFLPDRVGEGIPGERLETARTETLGSGQSALHRFELSAAGLVDVYATPPGQQKVELYLYDAQYRQVDHSNGGGGRQILTDNVLRSGTYFVRVHATDPLSDYTLEIPVRRP